MTYGRLLPANLTQNVILCGRKSFGRAGEGGLSSSAAEHPLIRSFGPPSPIVLEARLRLDGEKGHVAGLREKTRAQ